METRLDVLVIEGEPGVAAEAVRALEASGHHVVRCHEPGAPAFPCSGVAREGGCPVDSGVDVALSVRRAPVSAPGPFEGGLACALRASVPVVEQGPETYLSSWAAARADRDVVGACEDAAGPAGPLVRHVRSVVDPLLVRSGVDPDGVGCEIERQGPRLEVRFRGPSLDERVRQALGVKVLDALRTSGRTYGEATVTVVSA